jgi:signal peptidase I
MHFDFALVLVIAAAVTGAIWALDAWALAPRRRLAGGPEREPLITEYARSFFPIIVIVLVVRSFLYEPFRIPSSSMMPTLLVGDFIFVNKFTYGLRLPVVNTKILPIGEPRRGDVVVFKLPDDPATNYIKRLIGLPGDRIQYLDKRLYINGELVPIERLGNYPAPGQPPAELWNETIGDIEHEILMVQARAGPQGEYVVPEGHYFLMGDNRDNSRDSRFPGVGFVPEDHLVGKAVRIWMNWDWGNAAPIWSRIGDAIQ